MVAAIGIAAAACSDDDDGGANAQTNDVTLEDLQRVSVLTTMTTIRAEGLHQIDEDSQQASEIEAGWSGSITRLRQAVAGTLWPDDMSTDGDDFETKLIAAEDAIADDDLPASKTAISEAHAAWHGLEHAAYSFAAGEEHSEDDSHDDAADHDSEDDMAGDGDEHSDDDMDDMEHDEE